MLHGLMMQMPCDFVVDLHAARHHGDAEIVIAQSY